jgi:hypothetical protein
MRWPRNFTCVSARPQNSSSPSGAPAPAIASSVEAPLGRRAKWIPDEALTRHLRLIQVAARYAGTTDADFADGATRDWPLGIIEHVDLHAVNGTPDGHTVGRDGSRAVIDAGPDGAFSRSVFVEELDTLTVHGQRLGQ